MKEGREKKERMAKNNERALKLKLIVTSTANREGVTTP
jgi:hypothetical protein